MSWLQRIGAAVLLCATGTVLGCGGEGSSSNGGAQPAAVNRAAPPPESVQTASAETEGETLVRKDADGRKWLGKVPYDVWFDDSLGVAANSQQVAAATTPAAPQTGRPEGPMPAAQAAPAVAESASTSAGGSAAWGEIIPMSAIQDEVTKLRNHLTASMQSVGQYNGNYREIQVDGATLAALAGIVTQHPEPVSWKDKAPHVRDLGAKMNESATKLGREGYDATQLSFENVVSLLSGNQPAGLEPAEPVVPFSEVASRAGVMKRMDNAFQWLKSNISTEAAFKKQRDTVLHEATVLSALASVVAHKDYGSADEPEYQQYIANLIELSRGTVEATKAEDFKAFSDVFGKVNKACSDCHNDYAFE